MSAALSGFTEHPVNILWTFAGVWTLSRCEIIGIQSIKGFDSWRKSQALTSWFCIYLVIENNLETPLLQYVVSELPVCSWRGKVSFINIYVSAPSTYYTVDYITSRIEVRLMYVKLKIAR